MLTVTIPATGKKLFVGFIVADMKVQMNKKIKEKNGEEKNYTQTYEK